MVSGTLRPAVIGAGLGAGPGAAGAVAEDCAAAVGPDVVLWPSSPTPIRKTKPAITTSAHALFGRIWTGHDGPLNSQCLAGQRSAPADVPVSPHEADP